MKIFIFVYRMNYRSNVFWGAGSKKCTISDHAFVMKIIQTSIYPSILLWRGIGRMQIGELALFPAVRQQTADTIIVAPGTSCRHQIIDGTGRQAFHPIEILREAAV